MSAGEVSRREALTVGLAAAGSALSACTRSGEPDGASSPEEAAPSGPRVVVVGAGAFGGWTARWLHRAGARVTVVDAWGPGNSRASSGGDTRVIRATYGADRIYSEMVVRALELWREHEEAAGEQLFFPTGALWMSGGDDAYIRDAAPVLSSLGVAFEELSGDELGRRYPQIDPAGIQTALFEAGAGYLLARRGCQSVHRTLVSEGASYRQLRAEPGAMTDGRMTEIRLSDGSRLEADVFVFAGGPWLGELFPGFDPPLVSPTRQEILFFGAPPGRTDLTDTELPVWVETGGDLFYGIPGSDYRGFKVADDARGAPFDPTHGDRTPSAEAIRAGRTYMERRFPAMRGAPLLEARVCQYEQSRDGHLIVDTHPEADNVWIVGGGSGHGYKLGPALGEMAAAQVLGELEREPFFGLSRFASG